MSRNKFFACNKNSIFVVYNNELTQQVGFEASSPIQQIALINKGFVVCTEQNELGVFLLDDQGDEGSDFYYLQKKYSSLYLKSKLSYFTMAKNESMVMFIPFNERLSLDTTTIWFIWWTSTPNWRWTWTSPLLSLFTKGSIPVRWSLWIFACTSHWSLLLAKQTTRSSFGTIKPMSATWATIFTRMKIRRKFCVWHCILRVTTWLPGSQTKCDSSIFSTTIWELIKKWASKILAALVFRMVVNFSLVQRQNPNPLATTC